MATRALLALGLMIAFYALALIIAAGLLYVPYAEWVHLNRVHFQILAFCVGGAGIIVWSILPRRDHFEAPGPRLEQAQHPRLFEEIKWVANATEQPMPEDIYLVADLNAWVSQRGGILGVGGRRVMGLGLPLLGLLSVPELRAVLAHEFGHYHGGDTSLGPLVYRTRAAMERTLVALGEHSSALQKPFEWYAALFLRVSHSVSRAQELSADALAARVVGAAPLASGLKKVHGAGAAFVAFWRDELVPVLQQGRRPPIAEGFRGFLRAESVAVAVDNHVAMLMASADANPFDTHPSLAARIAALAVEGPGTGEDERAIDLLEDQDALEDEILAFHLASDEPRLTRIDWRDVPEAVLVPSWRDLTIRFGPFLADLTASGLPARVQQLTAGDDLLDRVVGVRLNDAQRLELANSIIGSALAILVAERGWSVSADPGDPVVLVSGDDRFAPFSIAAGLSSGELTPTEWRRSCERMGIADTEFTRALGIDAVRPDGLANLPAEVEEEEPVNVRISRWWLQVNPAVIFLAGMVAWVISSQTFRMVHMAPSFVAGVALGIPIALAYGRFIGLLTIWRMGILNAFGALQMLALCVAGGTFLGAGLVSTVNALGDESVPEITRNPILGTSRSSNERTHYAHVSYRTEDLKLEVSKEDAQRIAAGRTSMIVETRPGRLGFEWIANHRLQNAVGASAPEKPREVGPTGRGALP